MGQRNGKSIFGSSATKAMPPIEPTMGMDDVRKSLSNLNPMAQPIDIPAPDITNLDRIFSAKGRIGNMSIKRYVWRKGPRLLRQ